MDFYIQHAQLVTMPNSANDSCSDLVDTSVSNNDGRHIRKRSQSVCIRHTGEVSNLGDIDTGTSKVIQSTQVCKSIKFVITERRGIWRILGDDKAVSGKRLTGVAGEDVTLYEDLVVGSRMDGLIAEIFVVVVIDVLRSKSSSWATSTDVLEVVVVVRDVEATVIDVSECWVVANERCLVMVVEVVPRHCDPV